MTSNSSNWEFPSDGWMDGWTVMVLDRARQLEPTTNVWGGHAAMDSRRFLTLSDTLLNYTYSIETSIAFSQTSISRSLYIRASPELLSRMAINRLFSGLGGGWSRYPTCRSCGISAYFSDRSVFFTGSLSALLTSNSGPSSLTPTDGITCIPVLFSSPCCIKQLHIGAVYQRTVTYEQFRVWKQSHAQPLWRYSSPKRTPQETDDDTLLGIIWFRQTLFLQNLAWSSNSHRR